MTNREYYKREMEAIAKNPQKNICRDFVKPVILETDEPCISIDLNGNAKVRSCDVCKAIQREWGALKHI